MADLRGDARRRYVTDLFSRIAEHYDLMNTMMTIGSHHRWRKVAARIATDGLSGPALDVATGTGDLAIALSRIDNVHSVVGMDLLWDMVRLARSKVRTRSLSGKVEFCLGDGLSLPFADDGFACVTSGWGIRNMPDIRGSLEEMMRVVRPGGRIVSLDTFQPEGGLLSPIFRFWLHRVVPVMGQVFAGDKEAYTYLPRSIDSFVTASVLSKIFVEIGLLETGYRRIGLGPVIVHWGTKPLP